MVLQILADAGQVEHDVDVEFAQQRGRADAGALQELRRGDGPGADDDFAGGAGFVRLVAAQPFDAGRPLAGKENAIGQRMGDDGQIRALAGLVEQFLGRASGGLQVMGGMRSVVKDTALPLAANGAFSDVIPGRQAGNAFTAGCDLGTNGGRRAGVLVQAYHHG
jgi:hypothetical protein